MDVSNVYGAVPDNRIDNFGEDLEKHLYRTLGIKTIVGIYDFTKQGGAISTTYAFKSEWDETADLVLPKGAIIVGARLWTDVALTSGDNAQVSIGSGTTTNPTTNILAAAALGSGDFGTQYQLVSTLIGIFATANTVRKKLTVNKLEIDSTPKIAVSVGSLTAGRLRLILDVILP